MALDYIWPLNASGTPDKMNTSFGPRIDENRWDFHDGIDLPAPSGTKVHAMRQGKVHHAGPSGTGGYSSRHVVIRVNDPHDGIIYIVYIHLDSIDPAVMTGTNVVQGQVIGTVGDDDATYTHLHMEFRKGTYKEIGSVHPLAYLPYTDTTNFSFFPPETYRFNRLDAFMAARILFGCSNKTQGDFKRIEVDLRRGPQVLTTRIVDFNDKSTVNDSKGDHHLYINDIGVEGYQKSNMVKHERTDLVYGVLIRKIPHYCDTLLVRLYDVRNNIVSSDLIATPDQVAVDEFVDFEEGQLPPSGWTTVTSTGGSGTSITINTTSAHAGSRSLLCIDDSSSETNTQRAGIEYVLPPGRFEWRAQAWFKPLDLKLAHNQSVYLFSFLRSGSLGVAARIRNDEGTLRAGLVAKNPDSTREAKDSQAIITLDRWRKWRLELLRLGTRETTAILYLDEDGRMKEQIRLNWDSTPPEPLSLRAGIGFSPRGATAKVLVDEVWLTESELSS